MSHIKKLNLERPSLKDYGWIVAGCLIHLVNCEGINRLFGFTEDYMYLRSDLPFVIPGVPQWITLSLFFFVGICTTVLYKRYSRLSEMDQRHERKATYFITTSVQMESQLVK